MKIAMSGASGMVGGYLREQLESSGHRVYALDRELFEYGSVAAVVSAISGAECVINFSGAPIFKRWSRGYKQTIYSSRVDTTKLLASAIGASRCVKLFISVSAVGLYPSSGSCDEAQEAVGDSFLAQLCRDWEAAARGVPSRVRLIIMRLGVVFCQGRGAYEMISTPARLGLNLLLGSDDSYLAWVDIDDVVGAVVLFLQREELEGVFNVTSPHKITALELGRKISAHHGGFININLPNGLVRFAIGEVAKVITQSCSVRPKRLLDAGYHFCSPSIDSFLAKHQ